MRVKEIRKELNKTQAELADLLSVSTRAVQMWESGKRNIAPNTMTVLEKLLSEYRGTNINEQPKELTFDELVKQKVKEIVDPIMEEQEKKNKIFTDSIERMFKILVDLQNKSTGSNSSSLTS